MLKLNLGCGSNKIKGCVNIDVEKSCKPDKVIDFTQRNLPYKDNSVNEVYLFHTIEHIQKRYHHHVLGEIWRVLRKGGRFIVSFPEFTECYQRWLTNKDGNKQFWEATLFGRQLYPSDHHVCIIHTPDFTKELIETGFHDVEANPEPVPNEFNTFITAIKGEKPISYEGTVSRFIDSIVIAK